MKKLKIGVLLYTYNRVNDVRINMEIIRNVWGKIELLKEVVILSPSSSSGASRVCTAWVFIPAPMARSGCSSMHSRREFGP